MIFFFFRGPCPESQIGLIKAEGGLINVGGIRMGSTQAHGSMMGGIDTPPLGLYFEVRQPGGQDQVHVGPSFWAEAPENSAASQLASQPILIRDLITGLS